MVALASLLPALHGALWLCHVCIGQFCPLKPLSGCHCLVLATKLVWSVLHTTSNLTRSPSDECFSQQTLVTCSYCQSLHSVDDQCSRFWARAAPITITAKVCVQVYLTARIIWWKSNHAVTKKMKDLVNMLAGESWANRTFTPLTLTRVTSSHSSVCRH